MLQRILKGHKWYEKNLKINLLQLNNLNYFRCNLG